MHMGFTKDMKLISFNNMVQFDVGNLEIKHFFKPCEAHLKAIKETTNF